MRVHTAPLIVLAVGATLGLVMAQDRPAEKPVTVPHEGRQADAPREREADIRAIGELLASFVKAYNEKDAKGLGDLFTADAEIEDEDGSVARGRDSIVERFQAIFNEAEDDELAVEPASVRFLGEDVAIEEGTASLSTGAATPPSTNRYDVIYARQGGRWLHARIRDSPSEEVPPHERLQELDWLLGEWVNESDDAVVLTTCTWSKDGNFLLRDFDVQVEGRIALSGTQRIGWDAQGSQFRTWVFDDTGGFAEGLMSRDDDRWVIKATGVRSDGQAVSVTTSVTILDKDRLLWEASDRTIGGTVVPGIDRFTLVRRPPSPGK